MRKIFEFAVKSHRVKITNSWFSGAKLYIDGELRDSDTTFFAFGKKTLLSAALGELGVLEIKPLSTVFTVEMDAFLVRGTSTQLVYSSHRRLSLSEQRLVK